MSLKHQKSNKNTNLSDKTKNNMTIHKSFNNFIYVFDYIQIEQKSYFVLIMIIFYKPEKKTLKKKL